MNIGRLRHRCTLHTKQITPDGMGGRTETWPPQRQFWAEITLPTGRTQPVAQQLQATVTAEIIARYNAELQAGRRVSHSGRTYLIEAALPDNKKTLVRLLCSSVPHP